MCRNAESRATAWGAGVVSAPTAHNQVERELLELNRRFYDLLWSGARLVEPQRFNTWPLVSSVLPGSRRQLEVAPGLRPRRKRHVGAGVVAAVRRRRV